MSIRKCERLSLSEVAKDVGVHVATVWRWVLSGVRGRKLRSVHVGGRRYVLRADLDAFLAPAEAAEAEPSASAQAAGKMLDALGITRKRKPPRKTAS